MPPTRPQYRWVCVFFFFLDEFYLTLELIPGLSLSLHLPSVWPPSLCPALCFSNGSRFGPPILTLHTVCQTLFSVPRYPDIALSLSFLEEAQIPRFLALGRATNLRNSPWLGSLRPTHGLSSSVIKIKLWALICVCLPPEISVEIDPYSMWPWLVWKTAGFSHLWLMKSFLWATTSIIF